VAHHDSTQIHAWVLWRRQNLGVAVHPEQNPTSAALDDFNFQILQATPRTSKVMANQFISNDQKVPKKRCGMYGLSPFPLSLYISLLGLLLL